MKGKYKLTRFARFVIFLMLISPVCYLANNHFQSDLDIMDWKDKFNIQFSFDDTQSETEVKIDDFDDLKDEIDELKDEIEDLESELEEKDLLIKKLESATKEV